MTSVEGHPPKEASQMDQQQLLMSTLSSRYEGEMQNGGNEEESVASTASDTEVPKMTAKQAAAENERRNLGKRESRAILCLRIVVVLLFVVLGVTSGTTVYFWVLDGEEDAFETDFNFYAERVIDMFVLGVQRKLAAVDTLSVSITSYATDAGSTFPYVTMPDFEYKGSNARITGDTVMAFYLPYVEESNKAEWEAYVRRNGNHLQEAFINANSEKREQDQKFGLERPEIDGIAEEALEAGQLSDFQSSPLDEIWAPNGVEIAAPYFPIWQMTPIVPPFVDLLNMDFKLPFVVSSLDVVMRTGEASLDLLTDLTYEESGGEIDGTADAAIFDLLLQLGQYRHSSENYQNDPLSALNYPVFDSFGRARRPVGSLFITLYWRLLFNDILPGSIRGVMCVLENNAGQVASYLIEGAETSFLGFEDLHDSAFDNFVETVDVAEVLKNSSSPETSSFTSVDLSSDFIEYTLRVYPTAEFREIYVTGEEKSEAIAVGMIFAVTLIIFLVYDCFVQRRQRIVMDRAAKATAVVSSLFPETVREQIINDEGNDVKSKGTRHTFLTSRVQDAKQNGSAPALATKFSDCTVFFGDLAGFTKWSSNREPEEVFELLEALFKEFDAIAVRRGVFKVETIGDCYMAVTGLPQPQDDHAVRMAKFASDCLQKISEVTASLTDKLGVGTDDLTLRMGMHSGGVTAGVLRGEKSRFQLFGDTVNTASRMESTGVPRMIQVSQTTADSLILHGKSAWLRPREDKVVAKGKGEMQTYFLQIHANSSDKQSSHQSTVTSITSPPPSSRTMTSTMPSTSERT